MAVAFRTANLDKKSGEKAEAMGTWLFETNKMLTGIENGLRNRMHTERRKAIDLSRSLGVGTQYTQYISSMAALHNTPMSIGNPSAANPAFQVIQQRVSNLAAVLPEEVKTLDENVEKMSEMLAHATELRRKAFGEAIGDGDKTALKDLRDAAQTYDPFKEAEYREQLERQIKSCESEIKKFGKEDGSEVKHLEAIAHEVEQYGKKSVRAVGDSFSRMLFRMGQDFSLQSTEQQLDKVLTMITEIDVKRLATEVSSLEANTAKANAFGAALDRIGFQKSTAAAQTYLSSITEGEMRLHGLSNTVRMPGVPELLMQEAEQLANESLVQKFQKRYNKILVNLAEVNTKEDKRIGHVNTTISMFVADLYAAGNEASLQRTEAQELTEMLRKLNDVVDANSRRLGMTTVKVTVPDELIRVASERMRDLITVKEEQVVELAIYTYDLVAKAMGKNVREMSQSLDEYVRDQLELKTALRNRTPTRRGRPELFTQEPPVVPLLNTQSP